MTEQALAGMKVLDLTHYISGPFCTKLLADYGADVIKVEKPGTGDGARRAGPFLGDVPDPEKSGLFLYLNTNKKGITLNLKTETGKEIFRELVKNTDIVVESFGPDVMPGLGLDYRSLKKLRPGLVMTSISNFGQNGKFCDWKATEITLYALSGRMFKTGDPDREPLKFALNAYQYFTGGIASMVTIAAAIRNAIMGLGEHIDIAILDTILGDASNWFITYDYAKDKGSRTTAKNYPLYPFGAFPASDGYVSIQGASGRAEVWLPRIFAMIGKSDLLKNDPRFQTQESRAAHTDEFLAMLYGWLAEHTKQEIFDEAARLRYPIAVVYNTEELVNNPHYKARGYFIDIEHPVAGKLKYPGAPFKMSEEGWEIRSPAPLLGQHNRDVYGGLLGYSDKDLVALRSQGII